MAVKAVVTSLEGIPEALQAEYAPGEGGKFYLNLEGLEAGAADPHPAVGELARAKRREAEGKTKAEAKAQELAAKLEATILEKENLLKGTVPKDNFAALEASYKERSEREKGELKASLEGEISKLSGSLKTVLVDNVAMSIASSIAADKVQIPVFLPHIAPRLAVEIGADGKATTRVLDREGKPSASTIEHLAKEFVANPMFAPLVLGSKATGGGASGGSGGGGAPQKPGLNDPPSAWAAYAKAKRTGG
jgi:hypothetical protein